MHKVSAASGLAAVAVLVMSAASGASARPGEGYSVPKEVREAASRIMSKNHSTSDLKLVKKWPEVAATVPDPAGLSVVGDSASPSSPQKRRIASGGVRSDVALAASKCPSGQKYMTYSGSVTQKSLIGDTLYTYSVTTSYCRWVSKKKVTRILWRGDEVTNKSSIVYIRDKKNNEARIANGRDAYVYIKRELEYCVVKYGCYTVVYPYVKLWMDGDGSRSRAGKSH